MSVKHGVEGTGKILSYDILKEKCYNFLKKTPVTTRLIFLKIDI